jgi:cytochrome c oxidase subunit 4
MSTSSTGVKAAAAEHTDHSADHFGHHIKRYMLVFYALLIGTAFTVWASYIQLHPPVWNIILALVIACTKAFLVAGYFMHMISERKMIYSIMSFTAFFFVGLMGLTLWSLADFPLNTVTH